MKKVYIIHGWDGYPEEGWFPWLKVNLEEKGFEVMVPPMPEADNPRIENWVPKLKEVAGLPDEETFFVGHSMGCQTIARYLEGLPEGVKAGGVIFVAGFFKRLTNADEDGTKEIMEHWLQAPIDLQKVKSHIKNSTAIFSTNDKFVPSDNIDDFKNILGSKIIILENKGHFSGPTDNCTELPQVLEEILSMSK